MKHIVVVCIVLSLFACKKNANIPDQNEGFGSELMSDEKESELMRNEPCSLLVCDLDSCLLRLKTLEKDWWEELIFLDYRTDSVEYAVPTTGQSIESFAFVNLGQESASFFEVYDMTHQGNGYYYLYEYNGDSLKQYLKLRAVDRNYDCLGVTSDTSFIIQGGKLKAHYADLNDDGYTDIEFTGAAYLVVGDIPEDDSPGNIVESYELYRCFMWDTELDEYYELLDQMKGFQFYEMYEIDF